MNNKSSPHTPSIRCGTCDDLFITAEGKYTFCIDCPHKAMVDIEREDQSNNAHVFDSESGDPLGITYLPPLTAKDIVTELMNWMKQIEEQKQEALKLALESLFKPENEGQKQAPKD